MDNDIEDNDDTTFYSLVAEEESEHSSNFEAILIDAGSIDAKDTFASDSNLVASAENETYQSSLNEVDPDHIDISALSSSLSSQHTEDLEKQLDITQPMVTSMQSINLCEDTNNKDPSSKCEETLSAGLSIPSLIENLSDIVEMPTPVPQATEPKVTTPTSYFTTPSPNPTFTHQITPDVINVEEMGDIESSTDSELWLPSQDTIELISQSIKGTLDPQYLTKARPNSTVAFVSPAIELVIKYHGESAAQGLQTPLPPVSESNIQLLIGEGRFLSAVNMLTELLNCSEMNIKTIRLWTLRFSLLLKLKLYSTAEVEMAMFGNLDNCDLYYSFYPNEFPEQKGSIIPWSFRLLWSILPLHCPTVGGLYGALDRMYGLVYHLDQALLAGLPYLQEQRVIQYKTCLLVQVAGALAGSGSIQPAIKLLKQIRASQPNMTVSVSNAIIRLYYQVGNIYKGEQLLAEVQSKLTEEEREMNNGFKCIAHGEYNEAYQHFARVVNLNPCNTVASINGAVCLLYLGRLGDSIVQFEGASRISLHPMLLFNLVSLYELKTIASSTKKYHLLDSITCKSDWEAFPFECLRL